MEFPRNPPALFVLKVKMPAGKLMELTLGVLNPAFSFDLQRDIRRDPLPAGYLTIRREGAPEGAAEPDRSSVSRLDALLERIDNHDFCGKRQLRTHRRVKIRNGRHEGEGHDDSDGNGKNEHNPRAKSRASR